MIGIAGGTGSGKTTVAQVILDRVGTRHIALLPHDAYYKDLSELSQAQRSQINFDHPDSVEFNLLISHLRQLKEGKAVEMPVYSYLTCLRSEETITIPGPYQRVAPWAASPGRADTPKVNFPSSITAVSSSA